MPETTNGTRPPLLDLDVILESMASVKMDGVKYELKQWGAFSLRERNRLAKISGRMAEIEGLDDPTDADSDEHDALAIETMTIISDQPLAVIQACDAEKRRNAVSTFFGLRLTSQSERFQQIVSGIAAQMPTPANPNPPTSENGSRAYRRATAKQARRRG